MWEREREIERRVRLAGGQASGATITCWPVVRVAPDRHDILRLQCLLPTTASSFINFLLIILLHLVAARKSRLLRLIDWQMPFDQHLFQMNLKERILSQEQYGSTSRCRSADCRRLLAPLRVVRQPVRRSHSLSHSRQGNQTSDSTHQILILQWKEKTELPPSTGIQVLWWARGGKRGNQLLVPVIWMGLLRSCLRESVSSCSGQIMWWMSGGASDTKNLWNWSLSSGAPVRTTSWSGDSSTGAATPPSLSVAPPVTSSLRMMR